MLFGHNKQTKTNQIRQSQKSALLKVESIPHSNRKFFAKIDIKNAFYGSHITKRLSQLFGFCHRGRYLAMTVLPMGWFLSPLIFDDIVTYIICSCNQKLPEHVDVIHQQDDILIVGTDIENVKTSMQILSSTFESFGFTIRTEKCEEPSDSSTFCGLKLHGGGSIRPWPLKRQLNDVASKTAAEMFEKARNVADTIHVLRSWLGTANYFNKWLPPDLRHESLELHQFLPKLESGEISRKEVSDRAVTFIENLCNWWLSDSYGVYGGSDNQEDTLVVVDANVSGWSGCIFRITEVKNGSSYPLPFSLSGLLSANEGVIIPPDKSASDFTVVPVRFDGSRWNTIFETSQSSTWRERAACMTIVHKNRECLSGRVFIVSDNKNLVNNWKDTESLTASLSSAFSTYIAHVHSAIHVKRNHPLLQWVDNSARNLTLMALPVKRTLPYTDGPSPSIKKIKPFDADIEDDVLTNKNDDSPYNSEPVTQFGIKYVLADIKDLLDKQLIVCEDDRYFTTEKFPGKVDNHSLLVPSVDALSVLKSIHYDYGHPTVSGMRKIIRLWKLWIVNFGKISADIIANCPFCLHCRENYHPERSSIPMMKNPMEMIMADFLQPEKGTQPAFIVFKDRYSGFIEGRAIEKLDSFEVRQLLIEWISRYGPPAIFHTDNAEAFSAQNMIELYEKYHIFHRKSPVYEPKSNGAVERSIKAVEEGLRVELMAGSPAQEAIHIVTARLNKTSGVPALPDSSLTPRDIIFQYFEKPPFYRDYPQSMPTDLAHDLHPGDRVLVKIVGASKLAPQFEDRSFRIHKVVGNHVYSLIDDSNNVLKSIYRRDRLKPIREVIDGDEHFSESEDNAPLDRWTLS
jgi:hypothetical protein